MKIAIALLGIYLVTSIIVGLHFSERWFSNKRSKKREPRWMKILKCYCIPTGIFLMLLLFLADCVRKLIRRRRRSEARVPFWMVGVFQENALAIGGLIPKLVGVRVGKFILSPDDPSETRPNDLQVVGPKTVLLVQGGSDSLLVSLRQEGLSYEAFQRQLSQEDKVILRKLASNLAGWIWPDVGHILRHRVEEIGEGKVLLALEHLFNGVEKTMKR